MKFHLDVAHGVNMITRHEDTRVWVNNQAWEESVIVPWQGAAVAWQVAHFDALGPQAFARLLSLEPELILFGSGQRLRFAPAPWLRALIERGVGVETMDTAAACRTFTVLAGEGRKVVAALLVPRRELNPPST